MANTTLPDFLSQGDRKAFPVLSNTSKEERTISITLHCISKINELGRELLGSAGQRVDVLGAAYTPTEIVPAILKNETEAHGCPGGLIALTVSSRVWKAFVESEIGKVQKKIKSSQIKRSRAPVKDNDTDCVITIHSNQFASCH